MTRQTSQQRRLNSRMDLSNLILPPRLELDHPLVHTPSFTWAQGGMNIIMKRDKIGILDGPPGTGKTTFAQWAAERADRPSVIVSMPDNPAPTDVLRLSFVAVTGTNPVSVDKTALASELVDALAEWQGLLIVDEVQNIGLDGLTLIRWIHDLTRPKLPFLLVGYGALSTVRRNKPLSERIRVRREFKPLAIEDVFTTVRTIAPELENAPDDMLRYANDTYAHGVLRRWVSLIEYLQDWDVTAPDQDAFDDAIISITDGDDLDGSDEGEDLTGDDVA